MEIENNRIASLVTSNSGQQAPVDKQNNGDEKSSSDNSGNSDQISLTGEVRKLQELEAKLASQPVVDGQRVNAVRTAVENGTFTINAERIADKMMSLEQALTDAR